MKIMRIDTDCTDNGSGLRTVIYVAGCWHNCKGCHNIISWDPTKGTDMTLEEIIQAIEQNRLADVTISGGDSLTYQYEDTLKLVKLIKERTNKNIWLYTGYLYEELIQDKKEILSYIDVLIDGKFEIDKRDYNLVFRGSSNQRIINVLESLKQNKVVAF